MDWWIFDLVVYWVRWGKLIPSVGVEVEGVVWPNSLRRFFRA
jgi:hypothetical protein